MTTEKATTPPGIALDNEALDKLEALACAATPGPWSYETEDNMINYDGDKLIAWQPRSNSVGIPQRCANGAFIAAANPAAILALVAQARAAQPQPSAAPDGWKSMPVEPSDEMCIAAREKHGISSNYADHIYRTMTAVAPSPNFAARGAELGGMQADTNEATPNTCYKGWTVENLYRGVERLSAQLSAARQGQPTAAPTPHEQEARAAVHRIRSWSGNEITLASLLESLHNYSRIIPGAIGRAQWAMREAASYIEAHRPAAQAGMLPVAQTDAARDVLAERQRQVEQEGWMPEHDDMHAGGQMAVAAGYYALASGYPYERDIGRGTTPSYWPWAPSWWKPSTARQNLIKAGALILAEIERIDRAKGAAGLEGGAA